MSCNPERVTAYVDNALDSEATAETAAHLQGCTRCREQLEFEQGLQRRLRAVSLEEPTQDLIRRVIAGSKKERPRVLRWSLPAAAALAALVILGSRTSGALLSAELNEDHVACFGRTGEEKVFVPGPEPGPVAKWLAENGSPIPLPPRSPAGLTLVGARRCMLVPDTIVVAHLLYQEGSRQSSIFVLGGVRPVRDNYSTQISSHSIRLLKVGGHTVGIVSDSRADGDAIRQALEQSTAWNDPDGPSLTLQASLATMFVRPGGL